MEARQDAGHRAPRNGNFLGYSLRLYVAAKSGTIVLCSTSGIYTHYLVADSVNGAVQFLVELVDQFVR
jgi:hypothetical protein